MDALLRILYVNAVSILGCMAFVFLVWLLFRPVEWMIEAWHRWVVYPRWRKRK